MHYWGEWPNKLFEQVEDAAFDIGQFLRRWGRVSVRQTKEKYGTARVYCSFGWHQLHCITHPGYVYCQYPAWLWYLDCRYLSRIVGLLNPAVILFHKWLYRLSYKKALRKYPLIREEILCAADWPELLEGL